MWLDGRLSNNDRLNDELRNALATTLERTVGSGVAWCPVALHGPLIRLVALRGLPLGRAISQAVRFTRVMTLANAPPQKAGYVSFLYERVRSLRTEDFRRAIEAAASQLPPNAIAITSRGVVMLEDELAATASCEPFNIDYNQMPRVAALIDIMHNALGFAEVHSVLAPMMTGGRPTERAEVVTRKLATRFNRWLDERLQSTHYLEQARVIRLFLSGRVPDTIDDEAILSFWESRVDDKRDGPGSGFRLYVSAARAMLRYRHALEIVADGASLDRAAPLDEKLERAGLSASAVDMRNDDWRSPIDDLLTAPANRAKWLMQRELRQLSHAIGGDVAIETKGEPDPEVKGSLALFADRRFDLRFWRTLLRADVFGAAQASLVAHLQKRATVTTALDAALAPVSDDAYTADIAAYVAVLEQLKSEALAAAHVLASAGRSEALLLLAAAGHQSAIATIVGSLRDGSDDDEPATITERMGFVLRRYAQAPVTAPHDLAIALAAAKQSFAAVNRYGFRARDREVPEVLEALVAAADPISRLITELTRIINALQAKNASHSVVHDRVRFSAAFARLYGMAETPQSSK
jgi:hypothetical protein